MIIESKKTRIAYSEEEKYKMFTEGRVRAMTNKVQSKKVYKRKDKHKAQY